MDNGLVSLTLAKVDKFPDFRAAFPKNVIIKIANLSFRAQSGCFCAQNDLSEVVREKAASAHGSLFEESSVREKAAIAHGVWGIGGVGYWRCRRYGGIGGSGKGKNGEGPRCGSHK